MFLKLCFVIFKYCQK